MNSKKKALGRGLSALLQQNEYASNTNNQTESQIASGNIANIPIKYIKTNPFQPRTDFDETALNELAESIKTLGLIQPITVRQIAENDYQLISGERRFRASQIAGLEEIPAYIRTADDQAMLEMALVENIQRENLNPIEIAISYNRLIEECNLTQEEMSQRVGKNRSTIANYLRLLKLPEEIQLALRDKTISMAHARTIINIEDIDKQKAIFKQIIEKGLSVRMVEDLVRNINANKAKEKTQTKAAETYPLHEINKFKQSIASKLGTKVQVNMQKNGKGKITIQFNSEEEFEKIASILS